VLVDTVESSNEPEQFRRLANLSGKDLFIFQTIRLDIENTEAQCKAKIDIDLENENKQSSLQTSKRGLRAIQETRRVDTAFDLNVGLNSFFFPVKRVDSNTNYKIKVTKESGQVLNQTFTLRPVKPFNYIPADLENESVSKTLEYAYDDWCIAQLAKRLNKQDDYKLFTERSQFYRNPFDKETGFMRGRLSDGNWRTPFSPKFSSHRQDDYTEGNAWQYSWFVPHDVEGMIELFGGREAFIKKLDQLFTESSSLEGTNASPDISGLIGQYAHGNEPSHHIAYLYALAGAHYKTENIIRQITSSLYNDTPEGLCGNEDCGQMSAWYIFSALGFYPVNPASGIYVLGTPHFEKVEIDVGNGKVFTVIANRMSEMNRYVQSVSLNGKTLREPFIKHQDIMQGGKLVFEMGSKPNGSLFK
jgi:predicted alpha-1,2-mannosidase